MPAKLSYEFVKDYFEKKGCTLISKEYIDSNTKLNYLCPLGHTHSTTFHIFKNSNNSCPSSALNTRYSYEQVKEFFERKGYTLVSTEYVNNKTPLVYICNRGHQHVTRLNNLQQGNSCPTCFGTTMLTYEFVKEAFKKVGYELLSTEYVNAHTKLDYVCNRGHHHSIIWNSFQQGDTCPTCSTENMSGSNSSNWLGGVSKLNLPLFKTYAPQIENYHEVYKVAQNGLELLGVECAYCNQIFVPNTTAVFHRVAVIDGRLSGEANFYCSENCKKACPTYGQHKYPKGFKVSTSREVQPQLRKLVLARDNYQCQICDAGLEEAELHCHHVEAVSQNPIESADVDNCVTLCKDCHTQVHKLPGCNYKELRCN
jgi:hypothetical protein